MINKKIKSLINVPSRPVIIRSNDKDFTNLYKFLARAAVPFLFRYSLHILKHDPSKLSLLFASLILSLKSSSSPFMMLQNAIFTEWH